MYQTDTVWLELCLHENGAVHEDLRLSDTVNDERDMLFITPTRQEGISINLTPNPQIRFGKQLISLELVSSTHSFLS